jgi:hypothetical protein
MEESMVSTGWKLLAVAALCGLVSCAEVESPTPDQGGEDAITDSMNPNPTPPAGARPGTANLVGQGPIAYGTIYPSGAKGGGTSNWTSTYNTTYNRYEITITGESYYFLSYATVVTPMGGARMCSTDSVGGKLLINCYDHAGAPATSWIAFVTSEP